MSVLSGIRVIDATSTFLGPYCTLIMAELGADVVKVERPPHGDMSRSLVRGRNPGMSSVFLNVNRRKRSVALDLKQPRARWAMAELVRGADVFIHNMRPVAAQALGLSHDELAALNPTLVYCATYGFGEAGPYAGKPAYDDIIQGATGIASLQGTVRGTPEYVACVIADKTSVSQRSGRSSPRSCTASARGRGRRSRSRCSRPWRPTRCSSRWAA